MIRDLQSKSKCPDITHFCSVPWLYTNPNKPWREGYIQANSNIQIETQRIYCYFNRTRKQTGEFIIQYQKYMQQGEKSVQTKASDSAIVLVDREQFAAKIQMLL